jgi:hypothetical protein
MGIIHGHRWMAIICVAIATYLLSCSGLKKFRRDEKTVSAAQDEVYGAIVHDIIGPINGKSQVTRLVFGDALLLNGGEGWVSVEACKEAVHKRMRWDSDALPYNSFMDKMYRLVTRGWVDGSVGTEAMEDFLEKSCSPGHLSRTFHADLPRAFLVSTDVYFKTGPVQKNGPPSFEKLFPGADGIISFSRVGFDSGLDEAIVSRSFFCGFLCGSGWHYVLRKRWGKWEVASKRMIWVS